VNGENWEFGGKAGVEQRTRKEQGLGVRFEKTSIHDNYRLPKFLLPLTPPLPHIAWMGQRGDGAEGGKKYVTNIFFFFENLRF
jgi:hypothetical protein